MDLIAYGLRSWHVTPNVGMRGVFRFAGAWPTLWVVIIRVVMRARGVI